MNYTPEFERVWKAYGKVQNSSKSKALQAFLRLTPKVDVELLVAEILCYNSWLVEQSKKATYPKCHLATWLNQRRFESFEDAARDILKAQEAQKSSPQSDTGQSWNGSRAPLKIAMIQANPDWSFSAIWESWFRPTEFLHSTPPEIVCPNKFHKDYLENKFGAVLKSAFGPDVKLTVSAKKEAI